MKLPPFLRIVREVSQDENYETWFMAQNVYQMPQEDIKLIKQKLKEEEEKEPEEKIMMENIMMTKQISSSSPKPLIKDKE